MQFNKTFRVITEPTAEPIDLLEAKGHLRVSISDDDQLITRLISACRRRVEQHLRRALITQTWLVTWDLWPLNVDRFPRAEMFEVPLPPLQVVNSLQYIDVNGVLQTLDPTTLYQADAESEPARVMPQYMQVWPPVRYVPNAVQLNFTCGYGTAFAANGATLTAAGNTFANGDKLRVWNSGGALPTGLSENTDYYAVNVSGNTFGLSATLNGGAISTTGAGTGTQYAGKRVLPEGIRQAMLLLIGAWYESREAFITDSRVASIDIPRGVEYLLDSYRITGF